MKGGAAATVRKGISYNNVDLPPLITLEATRVCVPIGSSEILLEALHKFPGRAWMDAEITELLSFRNKFILASDLNAKHQF
jgi:hypothetical protein